LATDGVIHLITSMRNDITTDKVFIGIALWQKKLSAFFAHIFNVFVLMLQMYLVR
jgi:hypothetical protein